MTKKSRIFKFVAVVMALVMTLGVMSMLLAACGGKATISLDKTELTTYVGDTVTLTATVTGDDDAEIEWSTSDSKVATVKKGRVNAVAKGEATITAKIENGAEATCKVKVEERTVTIDKTSATINLDESATLQLNATASDGGVITWSSSNPAAATVNSTGLVTGLDITEEGEPVIIYARRGAAEASCAITIVEPSRPEDYYKITKLTNAEVIADPGVWHYHADGVLGGDFNFESDPVHQNSTATATLTTIPNPNNNQYFYFRYQPDQVEVNKYYTMTLKITISEDATLRIGSVCADGEFGALQAVMTAGEEKEVVYVGYRNTSEPFSVRINTPISADKVTLSVELVSVIAHDGQNLPDYHEHEKGPESQYEEIGQDSSEYDIEAKLNSEVLQSPGKWYYNSYSTVSEAHYNNGTINFNFSWLTSNSSSNDQLRYKPEGLADGTNIKVEFTVTGNVDASVVFALYDVSGGQTDGWTSKLLAPDSTEKFSKAVTIHTSQIIFIQVRAIGSDVSGAEFTFSDIKIYKEIASQNPGDKEDPEDPEVPDPPVTDKNNYTLNPNGNSDGSGANVIANPGVWAYMVDGYSESNTAITVAEMKEGTLTWTLTKMEANGYFLRFRPDLEDGVNYEISFDIEINRTGTEVISPRNAASGNVTKHDTTSGQPVHINFNDTLSSSEYLQIKIDITKFDAAADTDNPVTIVISNITVTDKSAETPTPDESTYTLSGDGSKSNVCGNPGIWYYLADGADGENTAITKAEMENGVITWTLTKMEANGYYLRYQPDLGVGTSYKISFDVVLNRTGSDTVKPRSEGDNKYETKGTTSGETLHVDFEGKVYDNNPFAILLNVADATDDNPVTLVISNIIVTAL